MVSDFRQAGDFTSAVTPEMFAAGADAVRADDYNFWESHSPEHMKRIFGPYLLGDAVGVREWEHPRHLARRWLRSLGRSDLLIRYRFRLLACRCLGVRNLAPSMTRLPLGDYGC